jgi:hypothetical protein
MKKSKSKTIKTKKPVKNPMKQKPFSILPKKPKM